MDGREKLLPVKTGFAKTGREQTVLCVLGRSKPEFVKWRGGD